MKMYKHEASGVELAKEIAQPHVTTFQEIFPDWAPYDLWAKKPAHKFQARFLVGQNIAGNLYEGVKAVMRGNPSPASYPDESMRVGPYCSRRNIANGSMSVSCADWVLSRIRERTIIIGGDTMSFEITDHNNGWSLVTANHGQILGSVWLAYIKTDSIPVIESVTA